MEEAPVSLQPLPCANRQLRAKIEERERQLLESGSQQAHGKETFFSLRSCKGSFPKLLLRTAARVVPSFPSLKRTLLATCWQVILPAAEAPVDIGPRYVETVRQVILERKTGFSPGRFAVP